ncbi:MAG: prolipoprotein diacylglyceryl transferase [Bacteroidetes bacterium]|nr:prolipoprotein diacylglyceryl transferase [Bacteroidota bacterium]
MKPTIQFPGKFLYAITFLILLPAGLWFWANNTLQLIQFPAIESKITGWIMMVAGGFLMLWAMFVLKQFGKGLPMNAYPPPMFVTRGPYRLFRHPIYWGFGIFMIGYFILTGSASGIWLVSPLTILGMIALVMGYEKIDLKKRFPDQIIKTVLDLPKNNAETPNLRDRFASLFCIVSFLVFCNFLIATLSGSSQPLFGEPLRVFKGLENPFLPLLSIVFLIAIPFFLKRKDFLREWAIPAIISLCYLIFIALLYPEIGAQYLPPQGPAFFTVPIFLIFISLKSMYRQSFQIAAVFTIIASCLVTIQLTNSRSAVLHFTFSILIFLLSAYYLRIWIFLKNVTEKIANSWKEWTFGKVRVINHGFYNGLGTFFVILAGGILAGSDYTLALMICSVLLTICAALWAQIIEGSAKLKRPFGYYGSVVGLLFGSIVVWLMGLNVWVVLGVTSVVMTWGQAIGRLRCLVNGCCHGSRINNSIIGIRFFHPRSRVNNISGLKGELLHPTQLYSILWLFFVGILLFTLWNNHLSNSLIFGLYLIMTSIGRFVEEAYRGEAQTPIIKGLRLYQWVAVAVGIVGILMTLIKVEPVAISPGFCWASLGHAAIGGLFAFFAFGVDFPFSNVRFSRLV